MNFVEKLLTETSRCQLSKEQIEAYHRVKNEFLKASSLRFCQVSYENMYAFNSTNKFEIDGRKYINGKNYPTAAGEKLKNAPGLKELSKAAYKDLSIALSHPLIKDRLQDDGRTLKINLEEAIQNENYTKIDDFFDNHSICK